MRKLALASLLLLAGCQNNGDDSALKQQKVTLRTLNSNNDLLICYNPLNCFFTPQPVTHNALEFLRPEEPGEKMISKNHPLNTFSPVAAKKVAEIKKMVQKPITIKSATRGIASVEERKKESVDFSVDGVNPEELKTYCLKAAADTIRVYTSHIHCAWLSEPISTESHEKPIRMEVSGELHKGETVTVKVNSFDKEKSENLHVSWNVKFDGQKVISSRSPVLTLEDLKPGLYQIHAKMGGNQEESASLIVE